MRRPSQSGFSLLELMIVIAIITVLSAIAIPNILRARQHAYEASAAGFMHSVQADQLAYRTTHGAYASSFTQLPGLAASAAGDSSDEGESATTVVPATATGATSTILRDSYVYRLSRVSEEEWYMTAEPILDRYNGLYYLTNQSGAVQSKKGAPPVDTSQRSQ